MRFHKYEALGNAYLILEAWSGAHSPGLFRRLCDRHYGIGADGVLVPAGGAHAGFSLRIFNPDGSEAEKSGNGLRIFARYLWDMRLVDDGPFMVTTVGGLVRCQVSREGASIVVDMGQATFDSRHIPVSGAPREVIDEAVDLGIERLRVTGVSVGNPHCVVYVPEATPALAARLGPLLERHPLFPNRTNVQFVEVIDRGRIKLEIWERGAGYTLASGSSSCAAAAASVRLGHCDTPITVSMPGGELAIGVSAAYAVQMTGPASKIAEGTLAADFLRQV